MKINLQLFLRWLLFSKAEASFFIKQQLGISYRLMIMVSSA